MPNDPSDEGTLAVDDVVPGRLLNHRLLLVLEDCLLLGQGLLLLCQSSPLLLDLKMLKNLP